MQVKQVKLPSTAYEIYQNNRDDAFYPLMLSTFIINSKSQFESIRAVRMLRDWLGDYKVMNQMTKHKYQSLIPRILKNLYILFESQADVQICMAPYYYDFHSKWPQLTQLIALNLSKGSKYTLRFIWYLSFDFCQKLDAERQFQFNSMLSQRFQQPLLQFNNPDEMTFKPLLQTVRMINIQRAQKEFFENYNSWCEKMIRMYDMCEVQAIKIQTLIEIIGCRSFLVANEQSRMFWLQMVDIFFIHIEKRLPNFMLTNQVDLKLLDWMLVIINFAQIQAFLIKNKKRFLRSMISKMKPSPDPKNAFHYEKYYILRRRLIRMFFFINQEQSLREMEDILTQFNRKSLSVLKDNQQNAMFFDSMCEQKLPISKNNIIEIVRSLANAPTRKNLPVSVLIILVRVLHAASQQQLAEQNIVSLIKSLSQCIASKISDSRISQLRLQISKFFITLATKYTWVDQKSTQIMLMWCQQFQRNNQMSSPQTIALLRILTKKHKSTVMTTFGHKLQALISDITYKMKYNKVFQHLPLFVSLLMSLHINIKWNHSHRYIREICTDKIQDLTFLYLYQSQMATRSQAEGIKGVRLQQSEIYQLRCVLEQKQLWRVYSRVNIFLYCIEIFFWKITKHEALSVLKQLDSLILSLFTYLNQQSLHPQMIHLAARVYFRIGHLDELLKLKSFSYFKSESFDILSKSFQKHTIVLMTYMYCYLMNRADDMEGFANRLNENRFLVSLFQGCNEFIGKSPRFYQQVCYIVLFAMRAKRSIGKIGNVILGNFKQIQKNIDWWEQAKRWVSFKLPLDQESAKSQSFLVEEFREYYEQQVRGYFQEQVQAVLQGRPKQKQKESEVEQQNDQLL